MNVTEAIRSKRAVRRFTDEAVSDDVIHQILDAGRRAQSSKNEQPWHFIVVRDRETLQQLGQCGQYAGHLAGAAFAVAIVSSEQWAFDIGQAAAYMQLAAWESGVGSCLASMWEPDKARAILGVPNGRYLDIAISFGYPVEEPAKQARPGGRRPFADVVYWEKWGL